MPWRCPPAIEAVAHPHRVREDRSRIGRGSVEDRSRIGRGSVEDRSRIGRGSVEDRSRIGRGSVEEGAATIARMVVRAGDRCRIMVGSGVRPNNAAGLLAVTGVSELHGSASVPVIEGETKVAALGFDKPPRSRNR
ncbi:hypothetical protein HZF05_13130 [Sphingomonas sp. CGMCC 1.13654]|uniref:Copper homeostasis protein cutC homolog n=1 Tax=Sphingomonas chungangi TaxID=2683589 RepID=A0A838L7N6_9SPHN|nr:copper homeostasis protein CutC [Sphingomonas chungangi]MBA2935037.1 hypothetical protein [Sphingomonas chungangi]MVW54153.1 hypothetical protein [Sphingomonas chungangi]